MKTPIGGQGILTPDLPKIAHFSCNSLEEVYAVLRTSLEKVLELSSSKEKETQEVRSQLHELTIKREVEAREAHNIALKYNELVIEHNKQMN